VSAEVGEDECAGVKTDMWNFSYSLPTATRPLSTAFNPIPVKPLFFPSFARLTDDS